MTGDDLLLELRGAAFERGLAQARQQPDSLGPVQAAVELRRAAAREVLARPPVRRYLDAQWQFHGDQAAEELAELRGVAQGYRIDERELFEYLHLGVLADLADGCTAWACSAAGGGALLAKNRDFRGEHAALQRVFRHHDPAWPRRVLAVGSLGSPGVYSSGINSDGLALADTQVGTIDHGVGLLRYFLMTHILARAATVEAALELIAAAPHAGGGTLVLADAGGALATVELTHRGVAVERRDAGFVARTNHFVGAGTAATWRAAAGDPSADSSLQRLAVVRFALAGRATVPTVDEAFALLGRHDEATATGLCRHGADADAQTISGAVFAPAPPTLYFSAGAPCRGARFRFTA